jgi:hypothetical protein
MEEIGRSMFSTLEQDWHNTYLRKSSEPFAVFFLTIPSCSLIIRTLTIGTIKRELRLSWENMSLAANLLTQPNGVRDTIALASMPYQLCIAHLM